MKKKKKFLLSIYILLTLVIVWPQELTRGKGRLFPSLKTSIYPWGNHSSEKSMACPGSHRTKMQDAGSPDF